MSHSIVLKSFAELAGVLDLDALPEAPPEVAPDPAETAPHALAEAADDLNDLLADLEEASATLACASRQDEEARALAMRDLDRYDALIASQGQAEEARARAQQVHQEAKALVESAFAEEARAAAARVAELATKAERAAAALAQLRRHEAERLAEALDLERLLRERRHGEEAEKAKAAEAERAGRLSGALARAQAALGAGRVEEAKAVLGPAANENPDHAEIAALMHIIAQRERLVNAGAAEDTLRFARRAWRHDPAAAVAQLEALDTDALPVELGRQVFGAWAQACARLCRERGLGEPLRYAPDPGHGAVLAREQPGAPYTIVSALGMGPGWQPGSPMGERQVRLARPLR